MQAPDDLTQVGYVSGAFGVTGSIRVTPFSSDADALLTVESSDDLLSWSTGHLLLHTRTDHPDGTADVTFRSPQPFSSEPDFRKYHRVRLDRMPESDSSPGHG